MSNGDGTDNTGNSAEVARLRARITALESQNRTPAPAAPSGPGSRLAATAAASAKKAGEATGLGDMIPDFTPEGQVRRFQKEAIDQINQQRIAAQAGLDVEFSKYGDKIRGQQGRLFEEMAQYGRRMFGSAKEGLVPTLELFKGVSSFEIMSDRARQGLSETTALLSHLGMGAKETAAIVDEAMMGFGMNSQQAEKLARGVFDLSQALRLPPEQVAKDFAKAQRSLAYDSDKLNQVFAGVQLASRSTGIEYDKLMTTFGDNMDTFEGSARAAGNLNSVLGGPYLNTMELLNATEDERITMVQDAFAQTGKNVNDLGKFELKSIAHQLKMTPAEAKRLLAGEGSPQKAIEENMKERIKARPGVGVDAAGQPTIAPETATNVQALGDRLKELQGPVKEVNIALQNLAEDVIRDRGGLKGQPLDMVMATRDFVLGKREAGKEGGQSARVEELRRFAAGTPGTSGDVLKALMHHPALKAAAAGKIFGSPGAGLALGMAARKTKLLGPAGEPIRPDGTGGASGAVQPQKSTGLVPRALETVIETLGGAVDTIKGLLSGPVPINLSLNANGQQIKDIRGVIIPPNEAVA